MSGFKRNSEVSEVAGKAVLCQRSLPKALSLLLNAMRPFVGCARRVLPLCALTAAVLFAADQAQAGLEAVLPAPEDDRPQRVAEILGESLEFLDSLDPVRSALIELEENGDKTPGMLIIKAGSWRLSATLFFPDNNSSQFQHVGHYPKFGWDDAAKLSYAVVRDKGLTHHSFGGPAETLSEENLARGAKADLPEPLLTLRIPLTGRAVLRVLEEIGQVEAEKPSYELFQPAGSSESSVSYLKRLVDAAFNDKRERRLFQTPSPAEFITPLDWTYQLLLSAHPSFSGCRNPKRTSAGETRRLTRVVIDNPRSDERQLTWDAFVAASQFAGASIVGARLATTGDTDPASVGKLLGENARRLGDTVARMLHKQPQLVELLASGVADPVFLNVIDCIARRELQAGESHPLGHIVHRSQYYRLAQDLIADHVAAEKKFKNARAPLFFAAAHQVTRLIGVGAVDVVERLPREFHRLIGDTDDQKLAEARNEMWREFVKRSGLFEANGTSDRFPALPDDARALLRRVNRTLFDRNKIIMRQLLSQQGGRLFDPLRQVEVSTSREFDLRMVLFEQGIMEEELAKSGQNVSGEQHPEIDKGLDDTLSRVTELLFALRPLSDGHDSQKFTQAVRLLAGTLHSDEARGDQWFGGFRRHGGYIFDKRFSNYWWRVAIGSAYVFVLHARADLNEGREVECAPRSNGTGEMRSSLTNEAGIRDLVRALKPCYLKYLRNTLGNAPRDGLPVAGRDLHAALREVKAEPDHTRAGDRKVLAKALQLVGIPAASLEQTGWYRCRNTSLGPLVSVSMEPSLATEEGGWRRVLSNLRRPQHAGSLAAAYESAATGGALRAPPGLHGPLKDKDKICEAIDRRFLRTSCLFQDDDSCGGLSDSDLPLRFDNESASIFVYGMDDAVHLRTALPRLWPFLSLAIEEIAAEATGTSGLIERTLQLRHDWLVALGYADMLGRAPDTATQALGFKSAESYRKLADAARGRNPAWRDKLAKGGATNPAASAEVDTTLGPAQTLARVKTYGGELQAVFNAVRALQGEGAPGPYPVPQSHAAQRQAPAARRVEPSRQTAGLSFDLARTGFTADGRPLHRAVAVYRIPTALVAATAESCQPADQSDDPGDLRLVCAEGAAGGKAEFSDQVGHSHVRNIPLGLEIADVAVEANGQLRVLGSKAYNDLNPLPQQARAALSSFGFAEFFLDADVSFEPIPADLGTIRIKVHPKLLGRTLPSFIITFLEDGAHPARTPTQQILAGLQGSLEGATSKRLASLLDPLQMKKRALGVTITLGVDPDSVRARLLREPAPETERGQFLPGMRVQIKAALDLTVSGNRDRTTQVAARAAATIDLDATGLSLSRLVFEDEDLADVSQALLDLMSLSDKLSSFQVAGLKVRLLVGTQAIGDVLSRPAQIAHALSVLVSGSILLPGSRDCVAPINLRLPVAELGEDLIATLAGAADQAVQATGQAAANCAIDYAAEEFSDWLERTKRDGGIEFLGVKWKLADVEPDIAEQEARLRIAAQVDGNEHIFGNVKVSFRGSRPEFSLQDMTEKDRLALGEALLAQIRSVAGKFVGDSGFDQWLQVTRPEIVELDSGSIFAYVDATLKDVPYFGDVSLGRLNLTSLDAQQIFDTLEATLLTEAGEVVSRQLSGEIKLDHIGLLRIPEDGVEFDMVKAGRAAKKQPVLRVKGELDISMGVEVGLELHLPLLHPDRLQIKVQPDAVQAAMDQINGVVAKVVNFAGDRFKIDKPRFAELAPGTGRYGLLFGATVDFGFVKLNVKRMVLSLAGIQLDSAFNARVPTPIELGYVALSGVELTYYTGRGNEKGGLIVGADVSPGAASVANLAKIDAELDLREVAKLKFSIQGDIVVLNSLPILLARGDIDLSAADVRFEARTSPAVGDVVKASGEGWIDGSGGKTDSGQPVDPSFGARTAVSILNVELAQGELSASLGKPGQLLLDTEFNTPIGRGHVQFQSRLNLGDPGLDAGVELDLLGWKPADARIRADLRSARARITFLLIGLNVVVRWANQFDPLIILDMLKSLFNFRLQDLLKLDPTQITITVAKMGSDGSIQQVTAESHDASEGDEGSDSSTAGRDDPGGDPARTASQQAVEPPGGDGEPPAQERHEGEEESMNDGFGRPGYGYCHRLFEDRYQLDVDHRPDRSPRTFYRNEWHPHASKEEFLEYHRWDRTFRWKPNLYKDGDLCAQGSGYGPTLLRRMQSPAWRQMGVRRLASRSVGRGCDTESNAPRLIAVFA